MYKTLIIKDDWDHEIEIDLDRTLTFRLCMDYGNGIEVDKELVEGKLIEFSEEKGVVFSEGSYDVCARSSSRELEDNCCDIGIPEEYLEEIVEPEGGYLPEHVELVKEYLQDRAEYVENMRKFYEGIEDEEDLDDDEDDEEE